MATNAEKKIEQLCATAEADFNLCWVAYKIIKDAPAEEKSQLLESFVMGFRTTPTDGSQELCDFVEQKEAGRMCRQYAKVVEKFITLQKEKNLSEKDCYEAVWDFVSSSPAFPEEKDRIAALYCVVVHPYMPYFQLERGEALVLERDGIQERLEAIGTKPFARMRHILNAASGKTTEMASLLLKMLDAFKTEEERTVFLHQVLIAQKMEGMQHERLFRMHVQRELLRDLGKMCSREEDQKDDE